MPNTSYAERRSHIETYFDKTAVEAWARLTSDEKVSGIRATVRAGRDRMRAGLLDMLPADMRGLSLLDAGCGTGALAVAAAQKGAAVTAVDLSPTLVALARTRLPEDVAPGSINLRAGDMLDAAHGHFDHVVAMDSLIHYSAADVVNALAALSPRISRSIIFTYAPRTAMLSTMFAVGKLFPRRDRSPAIYPVAEADLRRRIAAEPRLAAFRPARGFRIASGFYTSAAMELVRR